MVDQLFFIFIFCVFKQTVNAWIFLTNVVIKNGSLFEGREAWSYLWNRQIVAKLPMLVLVSRKTCHRWQGLTILRQQGLYEQFVKVVLEKLDTLLGLNLFRDYLLKNLLQRTLPGGFVLLLQKLLLFTQLPALAFESAHNKFCICVGYLEHL